MGKNKAKQKRKGGSVLLTLLLLVLLGAVLSRTMKGVGDFPSNGSDTVNEEIPVTELRIDRESIIF